MPSASVSDGDQRGAAQPHETAHRVAKILKQCVHQAPAATPRRGRENPRRGVISSVRWGGALPRVDKVTTMAQERMLTSGDESGAARVVVATAAALILDRDGRRIRAAARASAAGPDLRADHADRAAWRSRCRPNRASANVTRFSFLGYGDTRSAGTRPAPRDSRRRRHHPSRFTAASSIG